MSIERDANIVFEPDGTLRATTNWISKHDEGLAELLKNVRMAYLPNRSNVEIKHHIAAILLTDRTFQLTAGGIAAASRLQPSNAEQQFKLERELSAAVNKLVSHPVFAEWLKDHSKPAKFSGAGHFWEVAPGTPPRVVRDRIAKIESTLKEALQYMETRGVEALFKEKDRVLCERRDIERCIDFHKMIKERFSKEIGLLLS